MTLQADKLALKAAKHWALRDISFTVEKGEIFGILGSDEENTSEILRIISGLEKPTSGEIRYDGKLVQNGRKEGFFYLGDETTSRWRSLFSDTYPGGTASTHAQLVNDSLVNLKNVFLIENPVQNLDPLKTHEIASKLKTTTREQNLCLVVATNDPLEIFQLCDRVGVLSKGEIIQIGTPEEVYINPSTKAAAKLFGTTNLIPAKRVTSKKEKNPEFFTIEGEHKLLTGKSAKNDLGVINQAVTLSIRPEHISLSFGASFPEDNLLKARVAKIEFLGATTAITLDANGLKLTALVLRVVGLDLGEECMVGLPPDRIRILTK